MAKKSLTTRNNKRIMLFNKYKDKRNNLKKILSNRDLDITERIKMVSKLAKMPRNSSKVRIVKRCKVTGRSRGIVSYKFFPFSRIVFRNLAYRGYLPGVRKSSNH